ncbi:hypothetical protein ACIQXM_12960 [Arthrobacter sp. NPDC097144]
MPQRPIPGGTGIRAWTRSRKIYLAAGVAACLLGILLMAYPR